MGQRERSVLFSSGVPKTLSPEVYGAVYERMVNQPTHTSDVYHSRIGLISFTDQMAAATKISDPECFLLTANSAIPVADAVRGYYEEIGRPCPPLGYIEANSELTRKIYEIQSEHVQKEARRLRPLLHSLGSVAIIDQFVASGQTRSLAKWIAVSAGAEHVMGFNGNWYHDARPADLDKEGLTSVHADLMRKIGGSAAVKVRNGDFNSPPKLVIRAARAS